MNRVSGRKWSDEKRLLHYRLIDELTGCWTFAGAQLGPTRNYGSVRSFTLKRNMGAHRLAAIVWMGLDSTRSDLHVCHKCENTKCFNPDHLFIGTHADNMRDRKERGGYKRGEANPNHKLNRDAVRLIRELSFKGYSGERLARAFGVVPYVIRRILRNESWVEEVG